MFESILAVTEAFGQSESANDAAYEPGASGIRAGADRFCHDVVAQTVGPGRARSANRRRSILTRFNDDSARLFRPFRVF
ncbi:MAG TPA: hypothetical protein VFR59_12170 [Steroidobacteraceae bacterium]|nr:hypothetical protein [Steroidobacteraceae bacterium]